MTEANNLRPHFGRTALVTGSTSGIGLAVANRLAGLGADIALHGLGRPDGIERIVEDMRARHGVRVQHFEADLRGSRGIEPMIERIADTLGPVGILVNNAGMQHVSSILNFDPAKWDEMLAVNLSASFHTIRLCVPAMLQSGWGRIINMASVSGLVGVAGKPAYVATKHGLLGLTKSVALELAVTPVTCNAICPGWALTPLVQQQINALADREGVDNETAGKQLLGAKQPSQAFVSVEHIAALVCFLCSEDASQVRGAHWNMDGGFVAA